MSTGGKDTGEFLQRLPRRVFVPSKGLKALQQGIVSRSSKAWLFFFWRKPEKGNTRKGPVRGPFRFQSTSLKTFYRFTCPACRKDFFDRLPRGPLKGPLGLFKKRFPQVEPTSGSVFSSRAVAKAAEVPGLNTARSSQPSAGREGSTAAGTAPGPEDS